MCSCTRISTSVRSSPPRALYFCVRLYSANHQGLPIVLLVLAPQGFVLLHTSVRCASQRPLCGASLQRLCASVYCTSSKSFVRGEPTKALYSVRQGLCLCSFCVLYEPQELRAVRTYKGFVLLCTVRAPKALRGASLQRLCASVCYTSPTSFFRCKPTKTLYSVRQGLCFWYCTSLTSFVRCEPTKTLYSVHCTSLTSFVRYEPTKTLYSVLVFALQALHRVLNMCPCGRMSR